MRLVFTAQNPNTRSLTMAYDAALPCRVSAKSGVECLKQISRMGEYIEAGVSAVKVLLMVK